MYCRDYCAMLNNGCSITNFHNVHANHTGYVWWQMSETRGHCFIPLRVCIAWNRYMSAVHCDKNFAWSGVKSCRWPAVPTCDLRTTLTLSFHKFTKYTVGKNVLLSVFFFSLSFAPRTHTPSKQVELLICYTLSVATSRAGCDKISTVFNRLANQTSFHSNKINCLLDAFGHCGTGNLLVALVQRNESDCLLLCTLPYN